MIQRQAHTGTQVSNSNLVLFWSTFQRSGDFSLGQTEGETFCARAEKNAGNGKQQLRSIVADPIDFLPEVSPRLRAFCCRTSRLSPDRMILGCRNLSHMF